jgi:hypothetical protein
MGKGWPKMRLEINHISPIDNLAGYMREFKIEPKENTRLYVEQFQ